MLDKTFNPKDVEGRIYAEWEASGAFKPGRRPNAEPFCIVIPPPNVTGRLHIGHALNNTLQDILARFERMRGKDVLWQPGTDHAGIATQLIVERQLAERQQSRVALGREKFLEAVWKWKDESGGAIVQQQRRLGASADWSRERFTMDEGLSRAVLKTFVELHKQGLIYKDKRLVNWDPRLQTAVSDLEVENIEMKGHLWYIRYPIENQPGRFITVATTRPETMLGDAAVAVHPDDERYNDLVGRNAVLPLSNRLIPIIADEHSDPEKGTGAVKITPAHDFNDFEVGKRHNLPLINILNKDGTLLNTDPVPEAYRGLDRFAARKTIVADLEAIELLDKIEPITHAVPHDEKTKTVVLEPLMTEQWYLDVQPLADKAIKAVEDGRTKFVPENWSNVYFNWMRNIHPWCISRQLWWGHQIPVWYGPKLENGAQHFDSEGPFESAAARFQTELQPFCAETAEEARELAEAYYKEKAPGHPVYVGDERLDGLDSVRRILVWGADTPIRIVRDPDVLDTWFSSALWPFSTLGWPDKTPELARFYPTSVLVTGFDIIFFWVARMMMMGLWFMDEVPFHRVFIHTRVLDEQGAKMSKTKGNVVDPLDLIDEFGADALRFTLALAAGQGRDMRIGASRVEINRNFATKLWNAARFCEMNGCETKADFDPETVAVDINCWIVAETSKTIERVTRELELLRFNDASNTVYHFVYDLFCDQYLEALKPTFASDDVSAKLEARACAAWARDQLLLLLHPFMPFITEELWEKTAPKLRENLLIESEWPIALERLLDGNAVSRMQDAMTIVSDTRSLRAELNIAPSEKLSPIVLPMSDEPRFSANAHIISAMTRVAGIQFSDQAVPGGLSFPSASTIATILLPTGFDVAKERARLEKELKKAEDEIVRFDAKLNNEQFVTRAPEEVLNEQREKRAEASALAARLSEAVKRLA